MGCLRLTYQETFTPLNVVYNDLNASDKCFLGDYRYGYQGSEKTDEIKGSGNHYTTFFRELDPRLGRWWSIDPKTSSMPWNSPYISMADNPLLYSDVKGDSINDEGIYEHGDKELINEYEAFAKSKKGQDFLAQYAKAGQTIAGHTYEEDGKFHGEKFNLNLSGVAYKVYAKGGTSGTNGKGISDGSPIRNKDGFFEFNVEIATDFSSILYDESEDVFINYYRNLRNMGKMQKAESYKRLSLSMTLVHELFIHVDIHSKEYDKTGQFKSGGNRGEGHHNDVWSKGQGSKFGTDGYDYMKSRRNELRPQIKNIDLWNWMFAHPPSYMK